MSSERGDAVGEQPLCVTIVTSLLPESGVTYSEKGITFKGHERYFQLVDTQQVRGYPLKANIQHVG